MNNSNNARVFKMLFSNVYPLYIQKADRKGRIKAEVDTIIFWLTGYEEQTFQQQLDQKSNFETFFSQASHLNTSTTYGLCRRKSNPEMLLSNHSKQSEGARQ
jgi:hypothetical protein